MTVFRNKTIGQVSREALAAALPASLDIRKGRNGALYIAGPWGAWYMNCSTGQDFLLEQGHFFGAEGAPAAPETPPPAVASAPPATVEKDTPPRKKRSFLDLIGEFD